MQRSQIEQTLLGMIEAEAQKGRAERQGWLRGLFRRHSATTPKKPSRGRRGDLVIAGMGIALGVGCALFPWYIFFNQEKFGIRAMVFEGNRGMPGPITLGSQGERVGAPMTSVEIPPMQLDLFATGTLRPASDEEGEVTVDEQPFPGDDVRYRMVYVANGRAMIADDSGIFVVQRGSLLPDNSKVSAIEQRDGRWVLVTSTERVLELSAE